MNIVDIIVKTKRGTKLCREEINWMVENYVNETIHDYQISAWLMAVCFNSLTEEETFYLTEAMRDSGDKLDMSGVNGITVDKHSTGGIGDKTSLVIAPVCAVCGLHVPKMSGRGLGFTGGTIDKLESIEGFKVNVEFQDYINIINKNGAAIIAQSGHLVPADKKLYALRDVTGTVDSIPLICSSIMSKKLATGADCVLLDVKTGSGAFMKTPEEARELAKLMVKVGKSCNKNCRAVITDMNEPLGNAVGNSLEVIEACNILSGRQKDRLYDLCIILAANMLELGGMGNYDECVKMAKEKIDNGEALEKFGDMIEAQSGNRKAVTDYSLFKQPKYKYEIISDADGYVWEINSEEIGMAALMTGAGRKSKDDSIDPAAGIILNKHVGEYVKKGELVMTLYSSSVADMKPAAKRAFGAVTLHHKKTTAPPIVIDTVK